MVSLRGTQQNALHVYQVNRLGKEFIGTALDRLDPDPQGLVIKFGNKDDFRLDSLSFDLGKEIKCLFERLLEANHNGISVSILDCRQQNTLGRARNDQ
jgi:hypothetical protein